MAIWFRIRGGDQQQLIEMKMKAIFHLIVILSLFLCGACAKIENPYIDKDAPAPANVQDIHVESTPGGAVITYTLPDDPNLAYVEATYEIRPGIFREAKTSLYSDTLEWVGFGDTDEYRVNIYSVGRNEKKSSPILLTVKPLEPPVKTVFGTLDITPTFGGVDVAFADNAFGANLALVILRDTTGNGGWSPVTTYYTGMKEGAFAARGLDTLEYRYAVYIRDRWDNYSDTLIRTLKPYYEQEVPKIFDALHLPGDNWQPEAPQYNLERVWDGIVNNAENIFASPIQTQPTWFTVDLKQTAVFSRMKLFQRTSHPYHAVWVKSFEIWGTEAYNPDGSWDTWTLLGKFESRIPSGSVWPSYQPDDMDYQRAGEDFSFEQPQIPVRYIRMKVTDTYGGGKYQFGEFTFWGQIID